ncbi:Uncharacterized protein FKW44_007439, partial [Caligus rogercresseyi]
AEIELDKTVHAVHFTDQRLLDLQNHTREDQVLNALCETVMTGWPSEVKEVSKTLKPFWSMKDQLSVEDGFLTKGRAIVIPQVMRKEALQRIHEGHQGVTKCQLRAKDCVFWPGINKDIEKLCLSCHVCQKHQRANPHEPLKPHDIPTRPWEVLRADLFLWEREEYLIVADYYSKYQIVRKMPQFVTSAAVIKALKQIFSELGIPSKLNTDNGPQFSSVQFKEFAA